MWKCVILTGFIAIALLLQGSSGAAVTEVDEAGRNHRSLRYVFDKLYQRYIQSEKTTADEENILTKRWTSRKPVITSTVDDFTVEEGKDVTLPCKVNNLGRSYVIWKKDGTDIIKVKKMGRQWKVPRRYSSLHIDTGDMSLDETSLTLHNIDSDDQGKYLCTVEDEDTQVEHTVRIEDLKTVTTPEPSENEDDYYDYNYYENYEDLFSKDDEDEPENKDDKDEDKSSVPTTNVEEEIEEDYYENYEDLFDKDEEDEPEIKEDKIEDKSSVASTNVVEEIEEDYYENYKYEDNDEDKTDPKDEHSKSSSNDEEYDDDYYDYYEDLFDGTDKEETEVEYPVEVETTTTPYSEETSTTETPTEAPAPTEPARSWGWSFWSKPRTTVQTTTTETPTTEKVMDGEEDEYAYGYDDNNYGDEEDKEDIDTEDNDIEKDDEDHEEENFQDDEQEDNDYEDDDDIYKTDKDSNLAAEASQVAVGKDGMACLACTLPLTDDEEEEEEQEHVEWKHNNVTITPDGESIVSLRDGDMHTLLITSVRREDLGEYRCIIGENEAVIHLVAFPPKPIYKMVDKNSDGNYQITWEAKGLVSIDSYSITYRERNSPSEWWQQDGPFELSSPSSDDTYVHTFHNLQPHTDYEAIVSTIYQDKATTGDPFPFSVKRTGDMYPSSQKPGNGLVRAWMKHPVASAKDQALELVCMMDTKRRTKFLKIRYPVSPDYKFGQHPHMPVITEPIEVQWFHGDDHEAPVEDGGRIASYQKGKKNILKFTSVEPSDLGEYRCQGHTPSGIKEATVQLVAFPPPANKQEVTELNSGIYNLTWESKGLAPVTSFSITYRKSDSTSDGWHQIGPIQVNDDDNIDDKYSYAFTNLQPSSSYDVIVSTIYRDLATTGEPFSFTTKDASPSVLAPISYADIMNNVGKVRVWFEQPVVRVDMDTSAQLVCVVDEQQDMQVEWYHGYQKVVTDDNRLIRREDNRSILQFNSISTKDLGTYQCIAYNKFGRANAFARLTTADDVSITPPRGVLRSEDVTQWWTLTQAIFSDVHKYLKTLTRIPQPTELVY